MGKAISLIIQQVGEIIGAEFTFFRVSESMRDATTLLQQQLARTLDEQASTAMARWTIGQTPIAVLLAEHLTKQTIIGLYRQGYAGNNFLLRLRHTYSGLLVSHILVNIVGAKLKETGGPCKIFAACLLQRGRERAKDVEMGGGRKGRGRGQVLQAAPNVPPNAVAAPPPNEAPEAAAPAN